jgi:hypothetical protein
MSTPSHPIPPKHQQAACLRFGIRVGPSKLKMPHWQGAVDDFYADNDQLFGKLSYSWLALADFLLLEETIKLMPRLLSIWLVTMALSL